MSMRMRRGAVLAASTTLLFSASGIARAQNGQINVLTYHNDLARTGQNLSETLLTPATVNAGQFGKRFSYAVDGQVYAQPLYLAGVTIAGKGRHNVVFVATEHDSVYAFDADSGGGGPLWSVSLTALASVNGVTATTVPAGSNGFTPNDVGGCTQVSPEIGITSTPVIDVDSGTIYLVGMTKEVNSGGTRYVQRLHALDIGSGAEKTGSPVEIQATIAGTSRGEGNGTTLTFVPRNYKQRTGLLLLNGIIYTTWASHCDINSYHGWIMGYDAKTLQQTHVYNVTPNAPEGDDDPSRQNGGSFWGSGAAPAVDENGNIYVIAANGTYNPSNANYGNCFLRLVPNAAQKTLTTADYFAPYNQLDLNNRDLDTGSSGAILLPASVGSAQHPHLLVSSGKEGRLYVLDRDNLGHQALPQEQGGTSDTGAAIQSLPGVIGAVFGSPAYWNGNVYFSGVSDHPKAFSVANGLLSTSATSQAPESYDYPGSVPSVSANGTTGGIVWAIQSNGVLHAYDATNLGTELYSSASNSARDDLGGYVKFSAPTITNGRVYVGTGQTPTSGGIQTGSGTLAVYGLLTDPTPATDVTSQVTITRGGFIFVYGSGHYLQTVTLTNSGSTPITGPVSLVLDSLTEAAVRLVSGGDVTTSYAAPAASFYQTVAPSGGTLGVGQSISLTLEFANPSSQRIRYNARVLAGNGAR